VSQRPAERTHRLDRPHEPLQRVDRVDALVHQGTAAVKGPCAPPSAVVIVGLLAPPRAIRHAEGHSSETPGVDGFLEQLGGLLMAHIEDAADGRPGLVVGLQNPVDLVQRDLDRLFDHAVLAVPRGRDGHLAVQPARRRHRHHVDVVAGQQPVEAGLGHTPELAGRRLGRRRDLVADGHQFRVRQVLDRLRMELADHPRPNHTESVCPAHHHPSSFYVPEDY